MAAIDSIEPRLMTDGLPQLLVEVRDRDGNAGIGECWWGIPAREDPARGARPIATAVTDLIAPRYLGQETSDTRRLWFECSDFAYRYGDGGIVTMALSGVDMALWDLRARQLGTSVLDLLGGPVRPAMPAYASLPPLRDLDLVERETRRALAHGFTAVKLHELTVDAVRRVRQAGGEDLVIMVDVNGHFDAAEAIGFGNAIAEYDVLWYEEPVRPMRDVPSIARVASRVPVDIAAGENEYSLADFRRLLDSGAIDYLQPEITKIGGITPALNVGALAEAAGVALCPHNFRLGPSLLASIQWGFTSPATAWFEIPWVPESTGFACGMPMPPLEKGMILPPVCVGLGFETNR